MKNPLCLSLKNLGLAVGFLCNAVQAADTLPVLPTVTVTPPQASLSKLISNPQVLEEADLTIAHERSITDVMQGLPGVSLTKTGGYGQQSSLILRGTGGQGLISIDDIPLLPSIPGLQNLDTLPIEALQSAEIERGPSAIDRPFQALGGAIRLYTQDREETGARLSVEGGSFGIARETLQGALAGELGRMTLTLSRSDAFEGNHLAAADRNPEREPFRSTQGVLRFSSDLNSRLNWQGSVLYRKSWVGVDNLGLDNNRRVAFLDDRASFGQGETWLAQNSLNIKITPNWNSQLQAGYTQLASDVKAGTLRNIMTNRLYLVTLRNQHTLIDDGHQRIRWQVNWGSQGRHEQIESLPVGFDSERTMVAGFFETEAQYRDWSGQLGVRLEHFDQYGDHPLFKAATAWQIAPELTLRASGGNGYRIPGYTELLSLFFGNLNLKPERSASGDLSLEWFPLKNMHITLNGYYNRYDDLINQAYSPLRGPTTLNVADAEVTGMEVDAQYAWTDTLDTGISYTFNESRDLQSNRRLPFRPPHTARIWGKQQLTGLPITLWAEAIVRSATWNDMANTLAVNESMQLNASIRYAVTPKCEVYLRGENLTNNRTTQFYSLDTPGVAVYGGLKVAF